MLDEVQARGMHRRLKARFSPTEIFTITPEPTDNTSTQQANPTTPPAGNTATSSARKLVFVSRRVLAEITPSYAGPLGLDMR